MTEEQVLAIVCAYADLQGALEAHEYGDGFLHDWEGHQQTIKDLEQQFPFLKLR